MDGWPEALEGRVMRSATKRKAGKDPAYLSYIRSLPCCVCVALGASQTSA